MININIQTHDDSIVGLNMHGHAIYAVHGQDIVCAGASSIAIGLCNALDILHKNAKCTISNNIISIKILDADIVSNTIMKTAIIQLETMAESYKKNFKIIKQEV